MTKSIFVFGSNLTGYHSTGSALEAVKNHGAIYGQGRGLQGNSYAIVTKGLFREVLPLSVIERDIKIFRQYALFHPELTFNAVAIDSELAGYEPEQIAPMFKDCTKNVKLPTVFTDFLKVKKTYKKGKV